MSKLSQDQIAEVEWLRQQAGGSVIPSQIVDFARSENTALHSLFVWDDTEAAARFRLHQAKQVIRAVVTFVARPDGEREIVRAYVHDATTDSYRETSAVVGDDEAAEALLRRMRADVQRAIARYRRYAALAPHIAALLGSLDGKD